jgi:hypothetical protein
MEFYLLPIVWYHNEITYSTIIIKNCGEKIGKAFEQLF